MCDGSLWPEVELRAVTESAVDGPFGSALKTEHYVDDGGVRVVRLQNVGVGTFRDDDRAFISASYARQLARHNVIAGDIVVASMGDDNNPVARACQYPDRCEPAIVKADCFRLRINKSLADPRFICHMLNGPDFQERILRAAQGVTRDRVNLGALMRSAVPDVPLAEQSRIADILDATDESIHSIESLIAKLSLARVGLLHDLVENDVWRRQRLGSVASISGGVALGRLLSGSGLVELPYLRVANVQNGRIDTSDVKRVRIMRTEVERYSLQAGDFLMTEGGDFDKLGRGAVWNGSIDPCLHQNHVFRVRTDRARLLPDFLAIYAASNPARRYFTDASKQTTNLATINLAQVQAFPVPVPPLAEQEDIIRTFSEYDEGVCIAVTELGKLRTIKHGLAQRMLTGRVRAAVGGD